MSDTPADFLPWDSDFFGRRIARVRGHRLDATRAQAIRAWAERERIDALYFLADSDDAVTVRAAEEHGWRLQDIRLTFALKRGAQLTAPQTPHLSFRQGGADDLTAFRQTARHAYVQSRFYHDPCFTEAQCAALYDRWLERSLTDSSYAQAVIVAELDGQAAGFVTCHVDAATQTGSIGLVGVNEAARGQNVGLGALHAALDWFFQQSVQRVEVVTQGRNIGAQRLYQRAGFLTYAVRLWYHLWLINCI